MSLDDWRSKVLKDVQYLCKLAAYAIAWREGGQLKESSVQAEVTDRLKQGATALSLARRVMMSGSWIEDFRDLSAVRAPSGEGIASWKGATLLAKTASSVIDDVSEIILSWLRCDPLRQ